MSDIEEVKSKIDIVDFVGRYLPLKKAGTNYKGLCPFHLEKSPSFMVSADKQIWHCFGCGRGGDVIKFVMEKEGMAFSEALQLLADQAGVTLSKVAQGGVDTRKGLLRVHELATKFFERALEQTDAGRAARDYLIDRGLTPATIAEFRLGYAPASGRALVTAAKTKDVPTQTLEAAGLAYPKGRMHADKFVDRVIFPLSDPMGRVIAFTARALTDATQPKYLNSPETAIFKKGDILYGLDLAKEEIQKTGVAVLVEGQMDVISSHQAGVKNVVGTSGTAITESQMHLLKRYAQVVVLALDADNAGVEATKRTFEIAGKADLEVRVALLGEAKDPDTLIGKTPQAWQEAIDKAVPAIEFYFATALKNHDIQKLEGKKQLTREMLGVIAKLTDPVEKDHYLKYLSRLVGVEPKILYDAITKVRPVTPFSHKPAAENMGDQLSPEWLEERLVGLAIVFPSVAKVVVGAGTELKWASRLANTIYEKLAAWYHEHTSATPEQILNEIPEPDRSLASELVLVVEQSYLEIDPADLEKEAVFYFQELSKRSYTVKRQELVEAIAEAERVGDRSKRDELLGQLNQL